MKHVIARRERWYHPREPWELFPSAFPRAVVRGGPPDAIEEGLQSLAGLLTVDETEEIIQRIDRLWPPDDDAEEEAAAIAIDDTMLASAAWAIGQLRSRTLPPASWSPEKTVDHLRSILSPAGGDTEAAERLVHTVTRVLSVDDAHPELRAQQHALLRVLFGTLPVSQWGRLLWRLMPANSGGPHQQTFRWVYELVQKGFPLQCLLARPPAPAGHHVSGHT